MMTSTSAKMNTSVAVKALRGIANPTCPKGLFAYEVLDPRCRLGDLAVVPTIPLSFRGIPPLTHNNVSAADSTRKTQRNPLGSDSNLPAHGKFWLSSLNL